MTQLSSNTTAYSQVFFKIKDFVSADLQNKFATLEDRTTAYNKLLQDIYENIASPLTQFDPFIKGEPPISVKMNKFAGSLADDLNIIAKQADFLNAKVINIFNMFMTEIENEKRYLERIGSKSKILQMYSRSPSNDLVYLGDTFDSMDKVDITKIKTRYMPLIMNGECTLPVEASDSLLPKKIYINKIDGFLGNNHQVKHALNTEGTSEYRYVFEDTPNIAAIASIGDSNPVTFFELEALKVDKSSNTGSSRPNDNEFSYLKVREDNTSAPTGELISWADYDVSKPLEASFVIEFRPAKANRIDIVPYFASSKLVKVNKVEITKKDGSILNILSKPIFIGSSFIPLNLDIAKYYFYNTATIRFPEEQIIKAEVFISQESYEDIEIGHVYWKPNYQDADDPSPFNGQARFDPDSLSRDIYSKIDYDKFSLLPLVSKPTEFKRIGDTSKSVRVNLVKKGGQYPVWVITFNRNRQNDIPDAGVIKSYFNGWIKDVEHPEDGFDFKTNLIIKPGEVSGAKIYSSEEEAQVDFDALKTYIDSVPNGIVELQNTNYLITDVKLEYVTKTEQDLDTSYNVPLISQREIYKAKRLAIGLRDISVMHEAYANQSEVVSKPFMFDRNVEAVMLSVDSNMVVDFADQLSMDYFISVDGNNWIRISPIQLDNRGIAEVIVFNKNLTEASQLPGVAYLNYPDVPKLIKEISVKIQFSKSRATNITPSIYSYELIAKVES